MKQCQYLTPSPSLLFSLGVVLLLSPLSALAKTETVWNFAQGIPGQWATKGCMAAQQVPEGFLLVSTAERCVLNRATADIGYPIDALTLSFTAAQRTEASFLWHRIDAPRTFMVELPILLSAGEAPQDTALNLPQFRQWDAHTDRIGFAIPPHSRVILRSLRFTRWSAMEKLSAMVASFWTFDTFRPYSINFLWGPVVGFNPLWREQLFTKPPPRGWSANRVFLTFLFIPALLGCLFWLAWNGWQPHARSRALRFLGVIAIALWLLFDFRMGLEFLSYVRNDFREYVLKPPLERTFRAFSSFHTIASAVAPVLEGERAYGFIGPPGTPFGSVLRYRFYPALLVNPESDEEERQAVRYWLVVLRPDARVGPDGALLLGNERIAPPGVIASKIENHAFLFEVSPFSPPSSS